MKKLPNISTHFSDWYNDVIFQAELADQAPVRGCIVIRPYGYAIWENIQKHMDAEFKKRGVQNAAFPLLIPQSFLQKEAKHVEGFAPELAVVTHAGGKELEEPLVVRPTSETIIHHMFARWISSWRDLPYKVNQWCSVVRWEMRTRPFLRTTEFWWQEGHAAHETAEEARLEAEAMLTIYQEICTKLLAIPVLAEKKPESERFAGADETYTIEGLMPDGKALQMGTSHCISQSFAHAFGIQFQNREGSLAYPHLISWGATTRLIGAMVMVHGDDKGLVLPPAVAPYQVVIVPIIKAGSEQAVRDAARAVKQLFDNAGIRTIIDDSEQTPGAKYYHWELRGVPLRVEIGPRDIEKKQVFVVDRLGEKQTASLEEIVPAITQILENFTKKLFERALQRRDAQWHTVESMQNSWQKLEEEGGFYQTGWCGQAVCEKSIKDHKATIRCILEKEKPERCGICSAQAQAVIIVAKAY